MDKIIEGSICGVIGAFAVPTVNALRIGIAPNKYTYSWWMLCVGFAIGVMCYNNTELAKQLIDIPEATFNRNKDSTISQSKKNVLYQLAYQDST